MILQSNYKFTKHMDREEFGYDVQCIYIYVKSCDKVNISRGRSLWLLTWMMEQYSTLIETVMGCAGSKPELSTRNEARGGRKQSILPPVILNINWRRECFLCTVSWYQSCLHVW